MALISKGERQFIYDRDHRQCQYCGWMPPPDKLTLDHVIPRSRGGTNSRTNLIACCNSCNHKKGNRTPREARMPRMSKGDLAYQRYRQRREEKA